MITLFLFNEFWQQYAKVRVRISRLRVKTCCLDVCCTNTLLPKHVATYLRMGVCGKARNLSGFPTVSHRIWQTVPTEFGQIFHTELWALVTRWSWCKATFTLHSHPHSLILTLVKYVFGLSIQAVPQSSFWGQVFCEWILTTISYKVATSVVNLIPVPKTAQFVYGFSHNIQRSRQTNRRMHNPQYKLLCYHRWLKTEVP